MEDVMRKIYLKKHQELQKRKLDRRLNIDEPQKRQRLYKNIFEDYLPLVQSFDLETEIQMKKQIQFGNDFLQQNHRYRIKSVNSPFQNKPLTLPPINRQMQQIPTTEYMTQEQLMLQLKNPQRFNARRKQIQTSLRRKFLKKRFRIRAITITFIIRLNSFVKKTLLTKRQKTQSIAVNLLQIIDKMVNKYYVKVMEEQLLKYLELIKLKIQHPKIMLEKEIVNMVYFMSKQLANSAIIKELLQFIGVISQNGSFFPSDYLTQVQATRLEFNLKYGCLQNVTQKQRKMIIAVCVGLKIFCAYVLYRPWFLQMQKSPISPQQIINNYSSVIKLIHGTASILYYVIMKDYCDSVQLTPEVKPGAFKKLNIGFQQFLNIFPNQYDVKIIEDPTQIFPNQKKKLFMTLMKENPQTFAQIRENIRIWIDKIYNTCMKEEQKNQIERRQNIKEEQKVIIRYVVGKAKIPEQKDEEQEINQNSITKSVKYQNLSEKIFNIKQMQSERNSHHQSDKKVSRRRRRESQE